MGIEFNGESSINAIEFNGETVNEVYFNGVSVWTSGPVPVVQVVLNYSLNYY